MVNELKLVVQWTNCFVVLVNRNGWKSRKCLDGEAINCSLLWIMSKFALLSQITWWIMLIEIPRTAEKYLSWIDMKNISFSTDSEKYFQSVLQQASSLMSHGEDHLLSTIQVRVPTIFSIITILCQSWHNAGQLHKPQQGLNLSENWICEGSWRYPEARIEPDPGKISPCSCWEWIILLKPKHGRCHCLYLRHCHFSAL